MGIEHISGVRHLWSDIIPGTWASASGTLLPGARAFVMQHPFTIVGAAVGVGASALAGSSMTLKFWVNGARKGLGVVTLTSGAGARVNVGNGYAFTGPANSLVDVTIHTVGATAGGGGRLDIRYVHGWGRIN
jgi:hypothetical protein